MFFFFFFFTCLGYVCSCVRTHYAYVTQFVRPHELLDTNQTHVTQSRKRTDENYESFFVATNNN